MALTSQAIPSAFELQVISFFNKRNTQVQVTQSMHSLDWIVRVPTDLGFLQFGVPGELVARDWPRAVQMVQQWAIDQGIKATDKAEETMEEVKVKKRIRMGKWGVPISQMPWRN